MLKNRQPRTGCRRKATALEPSASHTHEGRMLSRKRECSHLMTEREFEEFWQTVDSRHRGVSPAKQLRRRAEEQARAQEAEPTLEDDVQSNAASSSTAAARSAKTARCGSCEACRAKDCGECS